MCALYCRCEAFQKEKAVEFCEKPLRSLKSYLEEMYKSKENVFLMLVYMSLNQMEIDVKNPNKMLFKSLEICKYDKSTHAELTVDTNIKISEHEKSEDILTLIPREFVDEVPKTSKYKLQHEVIKVMTLHVFGTFHFDKLLELSTREDLEGWIQEGGLVTIVKNSIGDMIPSLIIDGKQKLQYEQKNVTENCR